MNTQHPPAIDQIRFDCPHCHAFAQQTWFLCNPRVHQSTEGQANAILSSDLEITGQAWVSRSDSVFGNLSVSQCYSCKKLAVWVLGNIVYPVTKVSIPPNPDLPEDIKADYLEAASIADQSPRSAAGLLRLCIHKLCEHLGAPERDLNAAIGRLVRDKGLNPTVQKALDVVRISGNASLHPQGFDPLDDQATTVKLFQLINVIAEQTITLPKHVGALFEQIPEDKKKAIEKRDAPKA